MCKEMQIILVNRVVENWKKWKAEEEGERHKGSLNTCWNFAFLFLFYNRNSFSSSSSS
jgi:hypothetical protein